MATLAFVHFQLYSFQAGQVAQTLSTKLWTYCAAKAFMTLFGHIKYIHSLQLERLFTVYITERCCTKSHLM